MTVPMIKLQCKSCAIVVVRRKHCQITGIEHGRGWNYTCCDCRGEMEMIEDDTETEENE